jgi:ParB family chromosome partitioning protein
MSKNRVLGKGLSALIQGADLKGGPVAPDVAQSVRRVPLSAIGLNPDQPRKIFNDNSLEELADSIKQVGVLQPVLIRKLAEGETATRHPDDPDTATPLQYSVVAGERRVRAARLAGLNEVPALVCTYEETEVLKVALLENIQREDLGPVEEANAYRSLMDAYGATQEELAAMLGKKRSSVANMLRLLSLEWEILEMLQDGHITTGHAKALLGMPAGPARLALAKLCHKRGLSVRDCENRARAGGAKPQRKRARTAKTVGADDPAVRALRDRAEAVYGSPVTIERDARTGKGAISVRFYNDEDLIRLLQIMGVDTEL